ncbi:MAG: SDR family NAD(P)-dependent oxidoreductase [Anaerolineae bacterium]|nr:SDR family NAD(P)-dependent oxidoreductase [Anaerolineae bacterium]
MTKSTVLITGAAGGLGKAFAAECASRGWSLFLTDVSDQVLAPVAEGIERLYGVDVQYQACDLTDAASRNGLWQSIGRRGLCFHMLINVAGVDYEGPFDERKVDELHTIVRLNIEATVEMSRRVLPLRDPARMLRIINVSSLAGYYPMPIKAVYAASKRFLLDFSLALNQELRASGVTVTALCPAGMPTNPMCIRAIDAQGLAGQITTMNVGDVAARTIDLALAGRSVYVPGPINRLLRLLGVLVPPSLIAFVLNRRWRESYAKSHSSTTMSNGELLLITEN